MSQPLSRLGKQLEEAITTLGKIGARFALIGGFALAPHKVVRATQDVDLLIDADLADAVDRELSAVGYQCLHRSADAANYLRGDQRLDFLYAHLCYAMLAQCDGESLLELMGRMDRAIATAAETSATVDEINPPDGFAAHTRRVREDDVGETESVPFFDGLDDTPARSLIDFMRGATPRRTWGAGHLVNPRRR
jgi:hypothetical protein